MMKEVNLEQLFSNSAPFIDESFANCWLVDYPILYKDCSTKTVHSVMGENLITVGGVQFSIDERTTFGDVADLIRPKFFGSQFPLLENRLFLRKSFIQRWNIQIRDISERVGKFHEAKLIISAASGLGKSVELYLSAIFARYLGFPIQYIGNTGALVESYVKGKEEEVACLYLLNLLYLNADIFDQLNWCLTDLPAGVGEELRGVNLKELVYFGYQTKNIQVAMYVRDVMLSLDRPSMLIVDEHNALWKQFGHDKTKWPAFFQFYSNFYTVGSVSEILGTIILSDVYYVLLVFF
jgi:hypothetical protein